MPGTWTEPPTAPTVISPGRHVYVIYHHFVEALGPKGLDDSFSCRCLWCWWWVCEGIQRHRQYCDNCVREIVFPAAELESVLSCVYTDITAEITLSDKVGFTCSVLGEGLDFLPSKLS